MAHMQGTGGVGGDKFHLHLFARAFPATAIGGSGREDLFQHPETGVGGDEEIDEPRPRDFHPGDLRRCGQRIHQRLSQFPGRASSRFRQYQRQIAGEVAMAFPASPLNLYIRPEIFGDLSLAFELGQGALQQIGQMIFHSEKTLGNRQGMDKRGAYYWLGHGSGKAVLVDKRPFSTDRWGFPDTAGIMRPFCG